MRSPETFDAYYVETRTRLLHEAYALTGDAPASRAAVRDAFVVAWHRWRKVGQLEDRDRCPVERQPAIRPEPGAQLPAGRGCLSLLPHPPAPGHQPQQQCRRHG